MKELEEARSKFGRLVEVEGDDGTVFAFRPATRDMIADVQAKVFNDKTNKAMLMILTNFCEALCVVNKVKFKDFAADYPLMIHDFPDRDEDGNPTTIYGAVLQMARGKAKIRVK